MRVVFWGWVVHGLELARVRRLISVAMREVGTLDFILVWSRGANQAEVRLGWKWRWSEGLDGRLLWWWVGGLQLDVCGHHVISRCVISGYGEKSNLEHCQLQYSVITVQSYPRW